LSLARWKIESWDLEAGRLESGDWAGRILASILIRIAVVALYFIMLCWGDKDKEEEEQRE
jgi:hypothetical protein